MAFDADIAEKDHLWMGTKYEESLPGGQGFGLPMEGILPVQRVKHEIRILKSETNPKFECSNARNNQDGI